MVNNDFVYQKLDTAMRWQHKISFHNSWHQTSRNMKRYVYFTSLSLVIWIFFVFQLERFHLHISLQDSFVVGSSDEEVDSDCTEFVSENESSDFDEITIAGNRPSKRKLDEVKYSEVKKRRRIIEMSSDSD